MRADLNDWKNGWFGVALELTPREVDRLIELLLMIKADPTNQHFHISSDYKAADGLGDIEISMKADDRPHNLFLSGRALAPGEVIEIR